MDFNTIQINCSSIAALMGNSTINAAPTKKEMSELLNYLGREEGDLSERQKFLAREIMTKVIDYEPNRLSGTVSTELVKIYAFEEFGKGSISKGNDSPDSLDKGKFAEEDSIKLLSKVDGFEYVKNENVYQNKWFKGFPDVVVQKNNKICKIIEIKTAYDMPSFLSLLISGEEPRNIWQTMGYMDITGCKDAEIVHCLVNMPEKMMNKELERLRDRYILNGYSEEQIEISLNQVRCNMVYDDMPDSLKVIRRKVTYNKLSMKDAKNRVKKARTWLKDLDQKFKKSIHLGV